MGRSQNVRKSNDTGCKVGSAFSRKGRSATPVQKSTASVCTKFSGRAKKINVPNTKQDNVKVVSERRGSLGLSPIHESPYHHNQESVVSAEKRRNPPPHMYWKDIVSSSDASGSTYRDGTSDMIMPSGVSSFLLDCLDTSSPIYPPCQTSPDSSLPSPEIFRRADDGEELDFSVEGLAELNVKNSTLLDLSHAVDIDMRQPPNLSSILEVSRKQDETTLERGSPPARVMRTPFKQPKKIERARPVRCRKKVTFHESVLRQELHRAEDSGLKVARQEVSVEAAGPDLRLLEDVRSRSSARDPEEEHDGTVSRGVEPQALPWRPRPALFFDFADRAEKQAFLQKKRGKLPNAFPSKPLPVPDQLEPVHVKFMNSEVHDASELHEVCWIQLLHQGEKFFHNSHLKKVATEEGVFYEDYGEVRQFHGQVFFPLQKDTRPES